MGFFSDVDVNEVQTSGFSEEDVKFSDADIGEFEEGILSEENDNDISDIHEEYLNSDNEVLTPSCLEKDSENDVSEDLKKENTFPAKEKKQRDSVLSKETGSTVIAIGTVVDGNISGNGNISVDGTVLGDVEASNGVTILRHGVVNGNVFSQGRVHVSGCVTGNISGAVVSLDKTQIKGDISSSGQLQIGPNTVVIGNIVAGSATIAGAVSGNIDVKGHVSLEASAIVKGNIQSKTVQVASGAAVDGTCSQCYSDVNPTEFFNHLSQ